MPTIVKWICDRCKKEEINDSKRIEKWSRSTGMGWSTYSFDYLLCQECTSDFIIVFLGKKLDEKKLSEKISDAIDKLVDKSLIGGKK